MLFYYDGIKKTFVVNEFMKNRDKHNTLKSSCYVIPFFESCESKEPKTPSYTACVLGWGKKVSAFNFTGENITMVCGHDIEHQSHFPNISRNKMFRVISKIWMGQ
jgi:hypothetical protein